MDLKKIGNTPLIELQRIPIKHESIARIFAKLESFNPGGSIKDRVALKMIEDAEKNQLLKRGSTIIEPTSGNTGIGIAMVAREKGYRTLIVMPESMSIERRNLIQSYGAELVLTDAKLGMKGSIAKAKSLLEEIPDSLILGQFDNPSNPLVHYETTGPEIYDALNGDIDIFVAGVGTGGTITGVGKYLKEKNKNIKVIAVEPLGSPVLSKGVSGPHKIQGIGAGFVPAVLDTSIFDEVIDISDDEAIEIAKEINFIEEISAGISAGAALAGALKVASRKENQGKKIVVIFPDGNDRYRSTKLFE